MFGCVVVENDKGTIESLLFVTPDDAQRFLDFCNLYKRESGVRSGRGAYNPLDNRVEETEGDSARFKRSIDTDLVEKMVKAIAIARSAGSVKPRLPQRSCGHHFGSGVIQFNIGEFIPQLRPEVGDMYRLVNDSLLTTEHQFAPREGRVIDVIGEDVLVRGCHHEDAEGNSQADAEFHMLPHAAVMKIADWLKAHRGLHAASAT